MSRQDMKRGSKSQFNEKVDDPPSSRNEQESDTWLHGEAASNEMEAMEWLDSDEYLEETGGIKESKILSPADEETRLLEMQLAEMKLESQKLEQEVKTAEKKKKLKAEVEQELEKQRKLKEMKSKIEETENEIQQRKQAASVDSQDTEEGISGQLNHRLIVAALDIDTAFCRAGFSVKSEPDNVSVPLWSVGIVKSPKAPSSILLREDGSTFAFGFDAEKWGGRGATNYFFRNILARLHDSQIDENIEVEDVDGKKLKASFVIRQVIKHLKNDFLMQKFTARLPGFPENDILFVFPVPATWSKVANQILQEAAYAAGIDSPSLLLVKRPVAATVYCQSLCKSGKFGGGPKYDINSTGSKFMMLVLADNMAEIAVYERMKQGGLKVLCQSTLPNCGSANVSEEFRQMLMSIIGQKVFDRFCSEDEIGRIDFLRSMELGLQNITSSSTGKVTLKIGGTMSDIYKEETGETIATALERSSLKGKITKVADKLRINVDVIRDLFKPYINKLVNHVYVEMFQKTPSIKDTELILVAGSSTEYIMINEMLQKSLPGTVIRPLNSEIADLSGAVMFGHTPITVIT